LSKRGSPVRALRAWRSSHVARHQCYDYALGGYACLVHDSLGASIDRPVRLRLVGRAHAGAPHAGALASGEAVYVATGGLVPAGAAGAVGVVGVEHAREEDGTVVFTRPASTGAVRARG